MKSTFAAIIAISLLLCLVGCGNVSTGNFNFDSLDKYSQFSQTQDSTIPSTEQNGKTPETQTTTTPATSAPSNGLRPDFKKAMDDYESFYKEYCSFMKKYNANPGDLSLLTQYASMLSQAADMSASFDAWEEDDLTPAELKYYTEVNARVMKMLAEVAN